MSLPLLPGDAVGRLVAHDGSLFSNDPGVVSEAARFMGWTHLARDASATLPDIERLAEEVRAEGLTDVVLLGMGGSSLAAFAVGEILGGDGPRLHVLDTTCPTTVLSALESTDPATTIHLVSSKSGDTIEPNTLYAIFRERADAVLGREAAGRRFIALTDPGSSLQATATSDGFRTTVTTPSEVGGRFSALTAFGLLPAALIGVDVRLFVERAREVERTFTDGEGETHLARMIVGAVDRGHDKMKIVARPWLRVFGVWAEQLVAESLGKHGRGVVPVIDLDDAGHLADNEIRISFSRTGRRHDHVDRGNTDETHTLRLTLDDPYELGGWFVYWEYSTALAGAALGENPFDQPDVARAKEATNAALEGGIEPLAPQYAVDGVELTYAGALQAPVHTDHALASALGRTLATVGPGDYVGLLAYLPADSLGPLEAAAPLVSKTLDAAVCVELGPRYLHSTGQLHKGGPNTGVFIMVTARDALDLAVPGRPWTLRRLFLAQAQGDLMTLAAAGRRVVRVHLPDASASTIETFASMLTEAASRSATL